MSIDRFTVQQVNDLSDFIMRNARTPYTDAFADGNLANSITAWLEQHELEPTKSIVEITK
jgi:hypothetical protein